jgi:hypothetical protein
MHFSLYLLVATMRVSPAMRQQQRSFAFGGEETVCEPRRYVWGGDVGLTRTGPLPPVLMRHVPASHRALTSEVVYVVGWQQDLEQAASEDAQADRLEGLLRFQLAADEHWAVVFNHDDDGVERTFEGGVDDVIPALREAVAIRPARGVVLAHSPTAIAPVAGPYR